MKMYTQIILYFIMLIFNNYHQLSVSKYHKLSLHIFCGPTFWLTLGECALGLLRLKSSLSVSLNFSYASMMLRPFLASDSRQNFQVNSLLSLRNVMNVQISTGFTFYEQKAILKNLLFICVTGIKTYYLRKLEQKSQQLLRIHLKEQTL